MQSHFVSDITTPTDVMHHTGLCDFAITLRRFPSHIASASKVPKLKVCRDLHGIDIEFRDNGFVSPRESEFIGSIHIAA